MNAFNKSTFSQITLIDLGLEASAQRFFVHRSADLKPVLDVLEKWMRVLGYLYRDIFAVELVLYEAVTNALRHGHHYDPTKPVEVTFLVTPDEILGQVQDQGAGFNRATALGLFAEKVLEQRRCRGLFLMQAYTSWLSLPGVGNRVAFCRRRSQ